MGASVIVVERANTSVIRGNGLVQFVQWQYRTVDLNDLPPRACELDLLNAAGEVGWELVSITDNRIAFLKRQIDDDPAPGRAPSRRGREALQRRG